MPRFPCLVLLVMIASAVGTSSAPTCKTFMNQETPGPLFTLTSPKKAIICPVSDSSLLFVSAETAAASCGEWCWGTRSTRPAKRIVISGIVRNEQCEPLPNVRLEVWQPSAGGVYGSILAETEEERGRCRGHVFTDSNGAFSFVTEEPGSYGFLSGLLPGLGLDTPPWAPRHIHLIAYSQGYHLWIVQAYFKEDPVNNYDFRAKLGNTDLGATSAELQLQFESCSPKTNSSIGGEVIVESHACATMNIVLPRSTESFFSFEQAAYTMICERTKWTPGTPLPLCFPQVIFMFRPYICLPLIAFVLFCVVYIVKGLFNFLFFSSSSQKVAVKKKTN